MEEKEFRLLILSPKKCVALLETLRWKDGVYCTHCGNKKKISKRQKHGLYQCNTKTCNKSFSVISGTIFHGTKMTIGTWFALIRLMLTTGKGMSAYKLSRELSIPYKTTWLVAHRIRAGMSDDTRQLLHELRHHINHELGIKKKKSEGFYRQFENAMEALTDSLSKSETTHIDFDKAWQQIRVSIKKKFRSIGKTYMKFYLSEYVYHQRNRNNPNIFEDYLTKVMGKETSFPLDSRTAA